MKDDKPSQTAMVVACGLIVLAGDNYGRRKFPSEEAVSTLKQVLLASGAWPQRLPFGVIQNTIFTKLVRLFLRLVVHPDVLEGLALRKCFMEEHVRSRLSSLGGCKQVVVVAAGYDTLALRLSREYPAVQFYEIDHPATGQRKQRALDQLGQPENVHTVAADLTRTSLHEALSSSAASSYDLGAPTVVVVEGLLMYLTEEEVKKLFNDITKVGGPKSSVCFDFFGWDEDTNTASVGRMAPFMHCCVDKAGETWKWGIDPEQLQQFLDDTPWKVMGNPIGMGFEHLASVEYQP